MSPVDWITIPTSLLAAGLSIYNLVEARQKDRQARKEKEGEQQEAAAEWQLYADVFEASREGKLLNPKPGSETHRMAVRLTERGMFEEITPGWFGIPGQQIAISSGADGE